MDQLKKSLAESSQKSSTSTKSKLFSKFSKFQSHESQCWWKLSLPDFLLVMTYSRSNLFSSKLWRNVFFLIQNSWGNFHWKQLLHKKTVASFQSQAIYMEEVEIKQLRSLTKNPQNQNPVMVLWNWKGNFKVCQTSWT